MVILNKISIKFTLKKKENILLSSKIDFSGLKLADYGLNTCFYKEYFFSSTCTE